MITILKGMGMTFASITFLVVVVVTIVKTLHLDVKPPQINVNNINLSSVENGIYEGACDVGLVKVVLKVEVKDNKIISIVIHKHQNGLGEKAEVILEDIINKQSLEVDVITGATVSSNAIRKAIEVALTK